MDPFFLDNSSPTKAVDLTSQFPYLKTSELSEDELSILWSRLYDETYNIKHKFAQLMTKLRKELKDADVEEVVYYLVNLDSQMFRNQLYNCTKISKVSMVVSKYVSFFDYDLVEKITDEFGSESLKTQLQNYNKCLEEFAKRRVEQCPSDAFGESESDIKDSDQVCLIITDKIMSDLTLMEVKRLRYKFNKILGKNKLIKVLQIQGGSVKIAFRIVGDLLDITEKQKVALRREDIISIECGALFIDLSTIHGMH